MLLIVSMRPSRATGRSSNSRAACVMSWAPWIVPICSARVSAGMGGTVQKRERERREGGGRE